VRKPRRKLKSSRFHSLPHKRFRQFHSRPVERQPQRNSLGLSALSFQSSVSTLAPPVQNVLGYSNTITEVNKGGRRRQNRMFAVALHSNTLNGV